MQMGQPRQHLLMQLLMGGGHHQLKSYCIWGLCMLIPFLILFCVLPSGTSVYRTPYNRIVISQLQVPPLRVQSHHNTLPSDEILRAKAEEEPSTSSSADELDLASKEGEGQRDDLLSKTPKNQNAAIKAEMSSMVSSSVKAGKQRNKENETPTIETLIDKELKGQTNAGGIQPKKRTKKGKINRDKDTTVDGAIEEEIPSSGKGEANQDDVEVSAGALYTAIGRKLDNAKEEISSLGKEIGADEEDLMSPNAETEDSISSAEEEVAFSGKEKAPKQRARRAGFTKSGNTMGDDARATEAEADTDHASDLLFLENADKRVARIGTATGKEKTYIRVENVEGEDGLDDDNSIDATSHVVAKALAFRTKQPVKCRYHEGRWVIDSRDPIYNDSTCTLISINDEDNCKATSNKTKTTKWRWQTSHCKIERFESRTFLKIMQRKSLAFVGDNLAKAQMESLLCLLAQVERPNLVYEDKTNKSTSWHFTSSNFTISMIWSPYLVQEVDENGYKKLHLDKLDTKWAVMVPQLDVLVLGVGSLFIKPALYMIHNEVVGCYACKDLSAQVNVTNMKEISLYSGFRATVKSTLMGVGALPGFEGITLFLQPFGFEGNGNYHFVSMKMKEIQEEELYQAYERGSISNPSKMEVLHTDFISTSKDESVQGPTTFTCLVPSPLAKTWNEILHHAITSLLSPNS